MTDADLSNLTELVAQAPLGVRLLVGAAGAAVLFLGARLYRPGLLLAAFGVGAVGALGLLQVVSAWVPQALDPTTAIVGAVSAGLIGAVVAHLAHKLALVVIGALVGLTGGVVLAALILLPWWIVPLGAALGAIVLPWVYPHLLKVLTPAVGAVIVAWAVGKPDAIWLLVLLWAVGAVFQVRAAPARAEEA